MNYYHFDFPWKSKKPGLAVLQGPSLAYKYKDKTTSIICCTKLVNCVWKPYLQWWRKPTRTKCTTYRDKPHFYMYRENRCQKMCTTAFTSVPKRHVSYQVYIENINSLVFSIIIWLVYTLFRD